MLELLLCSMLTIVPDYLYRRYAQGKRLGKEISFYSVWFELRWGITGCLILTVTLITVIFYNHPSTRNVTLFFRTVPIVPEINGRVAMEGKLGDTQRCWLRKPTFRRLKARFRRLRPPSSRPWTNSRPSENCNDAIRVTSPSAIYRRASLSDPNSLPPGSGAWWRAMDRVNRGGASGGAGAR